MAQALDEAMDLCATGHQFLDMQVLEDVTIITTARPAFEVLIYDATLTEMIM
jgi:hypothetical protein